VALKAPNRPVSERIRPFWLGLQRLGVRFTLRKVTPVIALNNTAIRRGITQAAEDRVKQLYVTVRLANPLLGL